MLLHTNPEVKLRYSIDRYQIRSKCWHFIKIQINNTSKLWRCLSDVLYQMTSFDLPMFIACKHKFPELMKSRLSMEKEQKYISRYYQHDMPKISNMIWLKNKILLNVNNVQQISLLWYIFKYIVVKENLRSLFSSNISLEYKRRMNKSEV